MSKYAYTVPVVPARGGAEVALGICKTFLIDRTCMRRAPAKAVRACILRNMSHLKLHFALHTSHYCKPAQIYARGNTRWQQSCSHSTAICYHRFKKRIEIAEHRGETNSRMKRPQPQPPHTWGTFHRRLQPLYTEKHKVSCSGFVPKTSPMQHSCSHYNAFRSITCSMHMATEHDNNHAAIPMRSATRDSRNA